MYLKVSLDWLWILEYSGTSLLNEVWDCFCAGMNGFSLHMLSLESVISEPAIDDDLTELGVYRMFF
jgi:hypothetical protein